MAAAMDIESREGTEQDRLDQCLSRCSDLEKKNRELIASFEEKRMKFNQLYQDKEKLLTTQTNEMEQLQTRYVEKEELISKLTVEIQDLKMIASISESTKQEAVENISKRHQEELESLRRAMEESNEESQQQMVQHFDRERKQWKRQIEGMKLEKNALELQMDECQKRIAQDQKLKEEEELEASMRKAHAEAQELKSIVLPLEKEIAELKKELQTTQTKLESSRKLAAELSEKAAKVNGSAISRYVTHQGEDSASDASQKLKAKTDEFKVAVTDSLSMKSDSESDTQSFGSFQEFHKNEVIHNEKNSVAPPKPDKAVNSNAELECIDAQKIAPGPGQVVVSEEEWNNLIQENRLLKTKAARLSGGTSQSTPEQKHADLFEDDARMEEEIGELRTQLKVYEQREAESNERCKSLEESIRFSAEDAQKQITDLTNKVNDFERLLGGLKEQQIKAKAEHINKILELKRTNDKYREELISVKKERERLSELQEKHHMTLVKETSSPKSTEALYTMLEACRKALSDTRAQKDNIESKLQSEIAFMKERLAAEQSQKEEMETTLASELHDARGEIVSLQPLKSIKDDLERVLKEKKDLELLLEKRQRSYKELQSKSNEIIKGLKEKHRSELKAKEDMQSRLDDAKHKLKSLHGALETSEQVQRDFVRLSQTLQVELEQVRQERELERKSDTESIKSFDIVNSSTDITPNARTPPFSPEQARHAEYQETGNDLLPHVIPSPDPKGKPE